MSNIQICPHPLTQDRNHYEVACGLSVREMLEKVGQAWVMDAKAYITLESENSVEIVYDFDTVPAPGETLAVNVIPQGGGGGKNPLGMVLSIVVMASAAFLGPAVAGYLLGPAAAPFGAVTVGGFYGAIATGAITIAGKVLINALAGPQLTPSASGVGGRQTSPTYSITGTQNALNKYGPIPTMLGGTTRIWPTLAAEPYTEVVGEDHYLRQRFAIIGPVELSDFKIGETGIDEYEDVEIEWIKGFDYEDTPTLYADGEDIKEDAIGLALLESDGWGVRTTQTQTKEIIYDIQLAQLFQVSGSSYVETSVEYEVSYRAKSDTDGDWLAPDIDDGESVPAVVESYNASLPIPLSEFATTISVLSPDHTPQVGNEINISFFQPFSLTPFQPEIDESQQTEITSVSGGAGGVYSVSVKDPINYAYPTDSTVTISSTDGYATRVNISGYYTNSRLFSYRFSVEDGQYDVRWRRITEDHEDDTNIFDGTSVSVMRSIANHPGINYDRVPTLSIIDLRIKATGQINGVVDQFNCIASAYLPVYDKDIRGGVPVRFELSDNPAWAFFNVLYGRANKTPILDLARYDLDNLTEWAELCEAQGWKINGILDTSTTTARILQTIAAVGRSSLSMTNNKYGVATDWEKDTVIQVFTPRNSWGFESTKVWPEEIHAVRATFTDSTSGYELSERIIYADGYEESNATKFFDTEIQYVTSPDQVWKHYRYMLADRKLRPEIYSFNVDVENLRCVRGDRIRFVHDVMMVGLGQARIKSVTTDGSGNVESATIDSTWTLDTTTSYAINIQRFNGVVFSGFIDNPAVDSDVQEVFFNPVIPASIAPSGGELIAFGEADNGVGIDSVIHEVIPGPELTAKLVCQDYAPGIQVAADGDIPPYESHITVGRDSSQRRPDAPNVDSVVSDETVLIRNNDGSFVTRASINISPSESNIPVAGYRLQSRQTGNELWDSQGSYQVGDVFASNLFDGVEYDFRVQAITDAGVNGPWSYVYGHTVVGRSTPPPNVPGLVIEDGTLKWTYPDPPTDFAGFRVRYTRLDSEYSWETSTHVSDNPLLQVRDFDTSGYGGELIWMVKGEDTSGNESVNPAVLKTDLGDVDPTNVLETFPQAPAWPGGIVNGAVELGELVANESALWLGANNNNWWSGNNNRVTWTDENYEQLEYYFSVTVSHDGDLICPRTISGGSYVEYATESNVSLWTGIDTIIVWTGEDSARWWVGMTSYQPWPGSITVSAGDKVFFKVVAPAGLDQGVFTAVTPTVDVPDIEEILDDIIISTSGTRLTLTKPFISVKAIVFSLQDNGLGSTGVLIKDKDATLGPLLQAQTANALIDCRVVGY